MGNSLSCLMCCRKPDEDTADPNQEKPASDQDTGTESDTTRTSLAYNVVHLGACAAVDKYGSRLGLDEETKVKVGTGLADASVRVGQQGRKAWREKSAQRTEKVKHNTPQSPRPQNHGSRSHTGEAPAPRGGRATRSSEASKGGRGGRRNLRGKY